MSKEIDKKRAKIREGVAKSIYYQYVTSGFMWENEGQFYRDKYLGYADEVQQYQASKGVVIQVDSSEYSLEENAIEILGQKVIPIDSRDFVPVIPLIGGKE